MVRRAGVGVGLQLLVVLGAAIACRATGALATDEPPPLSSTPPATRSADESNAGERLAFSSVRESAPTQRATGVRGRVARGGVGLAGIVVTANATKSTTTAADGAFELPAEAGPCALAFAGTGVPRGFDVRGVWLTLGQSLDCGVIEIPAAVELHGRVVDQDGRPLADALVIAAPGIGGVGFAFDLLDLEADGAPLHVRTGTDGAYRIGGLAPGEVQVRAEHPDHRADEWLSFDARSGGVAVRDLVLMPAAPLHGHVVDVGGKPVVGATVFLGGGRFDPRRARQSTTTAADGAFTLRGYGDGGELTVIAADHEPFVHASQQPPPARIVLQPAVPLAGNVRGTKGVPGMLYVSDPADRSQLLPPWMQEVVHRPHPIAADGSFRVPAVQSRRWTVRAVVPGVGRVPPVTIELPAQPLRLELVPDRRVDVLVVDDVGAPVEGAMLVRVVDSDLVDGGVATTEHLTRWLGWDERENVVAGAGGRATIALPPDAPLHLGVRGPMHVAATFGAAAAEVPEQIRVVLPRAGVVEGVFTDRALLTHARFRVRLRREGAAEKEDSHATIDAAGGFRSAPLAPGRYQLAVICSDASDGDRYGLPIASPVPHLGDFESVAVPMAVEVSAGKESRVEIALPQFGEVRGRVLVAGRPLVGAIVWGGKSEALRRFGDPGADIDGHRSDPHMITGPDGGFRFLLTRPGRYELRARHGLGAAWSEPVVLDVQDPSQSRQLDIALAGAAVRGRFDLSAIPFHRRRFCSAQIYVLNEAVSMDPLRGAGCWHITQAMRSQAVALQGEGAFAFECLAAGSWVLRVVIESEVIAVSRIVRTTGDEVHDLGLLQMPTQPSRRVRCALADQQCVWLQQWVPGSEHPVYLRTIQAQGGQLDLGAVAVGRYRLVRLQPSFDNSFLTGAPVGSGIDIEILADGSCVPAIVWPDGVPPGEDR